MLHGPLLDDLNTSGIWLVFSPTHGTGDPSDNLQLFYDAIHEQRPDLSGVSYGAIGFGGREYDTFCDAIEKIDQLLTEYGASRLGSLLNINILDHDIPEGSGRSLGGFLD